ncbi:hypothetical protein [Desulfonauticus submarinus]|uniref:Uncharacterized protein n=1 Tax=Desulfonauticus submarinus TaxID=206665 RepID=A0A1H0BLP2_9BACT|nr:hypothetical protein [Desulfonauticus submarinus]SDN46576.1 hypothetical protein SAMN04488516_102218 [Desulfonauticus submarinus]
MNQKIFELGLSVDATSLYLILEALISENQALNMENIVPRWLAGEKKLSQSIQELKAHKIIDELESHLLLRPSTEWVCAAQGQ